MRCPHCCGPTLHEQAARSQVQVDVCSQCHGLWLDRGKIYEFTADPRRLEKQLSGGLRHRAASEHTCPRCDSRLERGLLPDRDAAVEECPRCGGLWFDADQLAEAVQSGPTRLDLEVPEEEAPPDEPEAVADEEAREKARQRLHDITAGLLGLPNLFLRSALLLCMLYGMVALVLISLSVCDVLSPGLALVIGVVIAALQFLLGPWIMDLSLRWFYRFSWVQPEQLPEHLHAFVERVCAEKRMKFPRFGLIHDGAPQAFTYGHHPGNARIVISQGIINLLEPEEVEAVVAHEIGHAHNWDMALMTLANLVPLLLYYLYRVATQFAGGRDNKGGGYEVLVGIGAYVLYVVSEYIVLWFSRTREYYADRFSGQVTKNPNALASALVKIAYGLAAQGPKPKEAKKGKKTKEKDERPEEPLVALRALNIFDRTQAVGLVVASSVGRGTDPRHPNVEHVKGAMQWDLWNPWAKWYELHSTHPLVAKRLLYLADLAAHLDQEPLVVFDRRQPKSYWDDFAVDVLVLTLPWWGLLVALGGGFAAVATGLGWVGAGGAVAAWAWLLIGGGLVLAGLGQLVRTNFSYRRDFFPHLSVAALMHRVKVSAVRPVPATLTGTVIGKGVPGLVWSKDFVMQDATGILFLDYQQPLAIWNFLFGLLRAGAYQGKEVRVSGWFRRAPVPYLEVNRIETTDGSLRPRRCYSLHARLAVSAVLLIAGAAVCLLPLVL